jgi:hypothetical protein
MTRELRYVRLSPEEQLKVADLAEKWGVKRSEVLRFCFRAFLLVWPGETPDLRGAAPDLRQVDHP